MFHYLRIPCGTFEQEAGRPIVQTRQMLRHKKPIFAKRRWQAS